MRLHCLLRNKETQTYEEMLGQIQRLTNNARYPKVLWQILKMDPLLRWELPTQKLPHWRAVSSICQRHLSFTELSNHCGNDEQEVLDYFETNYNGEQRRGRRLPPRYPHEMWNVSGKCPVGETSGNQYTLVGNFKNTTKKTIQMETWNDKNFTNWKLVISLWRTLKLVVEFNWTSIETYKNLILSRNNF